MGSTWISQGTLKNSLTGVEFVEKEYYSIFYMNLIPILIISYLITDAYFSILTIAQSFSIYIITVIQIKKKFKHLLMTEGARGIIVIISCLLYGGNDELNPDLWLLVWIASFLPSFIYVVCCSRLELSFDKIKKVIGSSIAYGGWLSVWLGLFNYIFYLDRLALSNINANLLKEYDIISRIMPFLVQPFLMRLLRILHRQNADESAIYLKNLIQSLYWKFVGASLIIVTFFWILIEYFMNMISVNLLLDRNVLAAFLAMSLIWQSATLIQKLAEKLGQTFLMCYYMGLSVITYATLLLVSQTVLHLLISSIVAACLYIGFLMNHYSKI